MPTTKKKFMNLRSTGMGEVVRGEGGTEMM